MLADVLRAQADWRSLEAIRNPEEPRHQQAETALLALAEYIETHAPGTPRETLTNLEAQAAHYEARQGFPDLGKHATRYLRRFGFEFEPEHLPAVLDELAECALRDAREAQKRRW